MDEKKNEAIEVVFRDFSKAFHSFQPEKLLAALTGLGVFNDIIQLSMDFLSNIGSSE